MAGAVEASPCELKGLCIHEKAHLSSSSNLRSVYSHPQGWQVGKVASSCILTSPCVVSPTAHGFGRETGKVLPEVSSCLPVISQGFPKTGPGPLVNQAVPGICE